MSKKSVLGLILFGCITLAGLFAGVNIMIRQSDANHNKSNLEEQARLDKIENEVDLVQKSDYNSLLEDIEIASDMPLISANPSDLGEDSQTSDAMEETALIDTNTESEDANAEPVKPTEAAEPTEDVNSPTKAAEDEKSAGNTTKTEDVMDTSGNSTITPEATDTLGDSIAVTNNLPLIYDSSKVDYKAYLPEMVLDSQLKAALNITNPVIELKATTAAILFDSKTKEVLFYKNAVEPMFPASTIKLLTSLVALEWCKETEEVTIGDEVNMIPSDSSKANLRKGQKVTIRNLLEGMLLPSGNDAAYVTAVYVGRKSLQNKETTYEEALLEFAYLMNQKAKELGAKNSCFITPDGYDAIGQYTTAYDMGIIGLAAVQNDTILKISKKSSSRNVFISGEDITWNNTNGLINKQSQRYYSYAIGLKTGTTKMAGRCLIAAGRKDGREVVCVIMNSSSTGRWEDAITLLKYGLE